MMWIRADIGIFTEQYLIGLGVLPVICVWPLGLINVLIGIPTALVVSLFVREGREERVAHFAALMTWIGIVYYGHYVFKTLTT